MKSFKDLVFSYMAGKEDRGNLRAQSSLIVQKLDGSWTFSNKDATYIIVNYELNKSFLVKSLKDLSKLSAVNHYHTLTVYKQLSLQYGTQLSDDFHKKWDSKPHLHLANVLNYSLSRFQGLEVRQVHNILGLHKCCVTEMGLTCRLSHSKA